MQQTKLIEIDTSRTNFLFSSRIFFVPQKIRKWLLRVHLFIDIAHCSYTKLSDGWAFLTNNFPNSTPETWEKIHKELWSVAKKIFIVHSWKQHRKDFWEKLSIILFFIALFKDQVACSKSWPCYKYVWIEGLYPGQRLFAWGSLNFCSQLY